MKKELQYNIIFLDIDGVLNSVQSAIYWHRKKMDLRITESCPICVSNLNYLIEKLPDIKFVITSTWRYNNTLKQLCNIFQGWGFFVRNNIIGVTPRVEGADRGKEIKKWLDEASGNVLVKSYLIIDDDFDMGELSSHLIKVDNRVGLTIVNVQEIIDYFTVGAKNGS